MKVKRDTKSDRLEGWIVRKGKGKQEKGEVTREEREKEGKRGKGDRDGETKEKERAEEKVRQTLRQGLEKPLVAQQAGALGAAPPSTQQIHSVQEHKTKIHDLEEEVSVIR